MASFYMERLNNIIHRLYQLGNIIFLVRKVIVKNYYVSLLNIPSIVLDLFC